jgi:hypothetical protein
LNVSRVELFEDISIEFEDCPRKSVFLEQHELSQHSPPGANHSHDGGQKKGGQQGGGQQGGGKQGGKQGGQQGGGQQFL